jgi:hypothetical protein
MKAKIPSMKKGYQALNKRLNGYVMQVFAIYDNMNREAANIVRRTGYDGSQPFRWADYPKTKNQLLDLQTQFCKELRGLIYSTTSTEWENSNLMQDLIADKMMKAYKAQKGGERVKRYYQTNPDALKAFQERKDNGLNLSQKVWKQSQYYRDALEVAISVAIQKGTSAITLSKQISQYLQNFDLIKKDYKERYGHAIDIADCEYRSARLARSEINIAYRKAEQTRWNQFDFVVGKEIKTSNTHEDSMPKGDICDRLAGRYPKDFDWVGWHPQCKCYEIPILKSEDDFWNEDEDYVPEDYVSDVPDNFKEWVMENEGRISEAEEKGTLPYFLRDNEQVYKGVLDDANETRFTADFPKFKFIMDGWDGWETPREEFENWGKKREILYGGNIFAVAHSFEDDKIPDRIKAFVKPFNDEERLGLDSFNHLYALEKATAKDVAPEFRNEFRKVVERLNGMDFSEGMMKGKKYIDVEYAYNMLQLSKDETILANIKDVSPKMPYLLKGFGGKFKYSDMPGKEFWDLLDTYVPATAVYGDTSYCSWQGYVGLKISDRLNCDYQRNRVLTHEYGHAVDMQRDLRKDKDILSLYRGFKESVAADRAVSAENALNDFIVKFTNEGVRAGNNLYKEGMSDATFNKLWASSGLEKKYDYNTRSEKLGCYSDILMAAIEGERWISPGGHDAEYFKTEESQVMEFIAHMFTNVYTGNDLFEKVNPKLYNDMVTLLRKKLR